MKPAAKWARALGGTFAVMVAAWLMPACTSRTGFQTPKPAKIERVNYHGWTNAFRLQNERVEVIVVPEVGRVMSFRFRDGENIFWEDCSLDGGRGDWEAKEWINFGGDKTWPAPEAEWNNYTRRKEWRPPPAFDSLPVEAHIDGSDVVITAPVDPYYGVRTSRRIQLPPGPATAMTITTTYERMSGEPSRIGVWVITQFKEPAAIYVPVRTNSIFTNGYYVFGTQRWPQLVARSDHIKITRDPKSPHKMGSDASRLLWVGEKDMCLVSSPRVSDAGYPDRGASAEVYTNPDPKKYIELELLGPLSLMSSGDKISRTSTYTLFKRTKKDLEAERQWLLPP